MVKRSISWILCLMMIVSLFAGAMTSAKAADIGVKVTPTSDVINGTGSAEFTVATFVEVLAEQIRSGEGLDLNELTETLLGVGFTPESLAALLSGAGFNWGDILGALQGNGFDMNAIAGMMLDMLDSGAVQLEDVVSDLVGNSEMLNSLLKALQNGGLSSDLLQTLLGMLQGTGSGSFLDLIRSLFGGTGILSGALPFEDEPEADTMEAPAFWAAVEEFFAPYITPELLAQIKTVIGDVREIPFDEAVSALGQFFGDHVDESGFVEFVSNVTGGEFDYTALVEALRAQLGEMVDMEAIAKAFSDALGEELDLSKLVSALANAMRGEITMDELMNALGDHVDEDAFFQSISEWFNQNAGENDAAAMLQAMIAALQAQGFENFDLEALSENFDPAALMSAIAGLLPEGALNADAVRAAFEQALADIQSGEFDMSALLSALGDHVDEDAMFKSITDWLNQNAGENDAAAMLQAMIAALRAQGFEDFSLEELTAAMGEGFDPAALLSAIVGLLPEGTLDTDAVKAAFEQALASIQNGEFDMSELLSALGDHVDEDALFQSVTDWLNENAGENDAVAMLQALIAAMREQGFESFDLSALTAALTAALGENFDPSALLAAIADRLPEGTLDVDAVKEAFEQALADIQSGEFDISALLAALGDHVDENALLQSITDWLNENAGENDAVAMLQALIAALQEQGIENFDLEALTAALGENFDPAAFLRALASLLPEGTLDVDAVKEAIENALGEQVDLDVLIDAIVAAMGEEFDFETMLQALLTGLQDAGVELPTVDSLLEAIADEFGNLDADSLKVLLETLTAQFEGEVDIPALLSAVLNAFKDQIDLDALMEAMTEVFGEDFGGRLQEILQQLLDNGFDFSEILEALQNYDFDLDTILNTLFGSSLTYTWNVYTDDGYVPVAEAEDANVYSGADTPTLTVQRDVAPEQDEVYIYFCTLDVFGQTLDSFDAVLLIKAPEAPADPTDPVVPVLDNETHTAYITGYEDGTVRPENNITRAEVATILFRLLTAESRAQFGTLANSFSDVAPADWFNEAVSTLAKANVLQGYPDGTFQPNALISRAELATVLTRLSVLVSLEKEVNPVNFSDVANHWAAAFIQIAADNGWINGYDDGSFRPGKSITRAEAVTMINRMLNRNPETLPESGMIVFSDNSNPDAWYYIQIQEAANAHEYTRNDKGVEIWVSAA